MSTSATVLYTNADGNARFDMDYYLKTHMPLVAKHWGPYGLKEWRITHFHAGLGGSSPEFRVEAKLYWDSIESVKTATQSESAKVVFGDVPNFTDISPTFLAGEQVGQATV